MYCIYCIVFTFILNPVEVLFSMESIIIISHFISTTGTTLLLHATDLFNVNTRIIGLLFYR